jgi:cytochrome c5
MHTESARPSVCGIVAAIVVLSLSACGPGSESGESLAAKVKTAETLIPADARLAEIYERSCRVCHVSPDSGAPLAGDTSAWKARFVQGTDTLVDHVRDGFKAMPPHGQCFDCSDDDLRHLTLFMAREREQ